LIKKKLKLVHANLKKTTSFKGFRVRMFNTTFNNISVISRQSVLLVVEIGVSGKKPLTCCKSLTNFIT
jgi:hypothetical protein